MPMQINNYCACKYNRGNVSKVLPVLMHSKVEPHLYLHLSATFHSFLYFYLHVINFLACTQSCTATLEIHLWCIIPAAKKVVSDSPGLVDFAIGLVIFVLNLPWASAVFGGNSNYRGL